MHDMRIEPNGKGGFMFVGEIDEETLLCNKDGVCTSTVHLEVRKILLSVIENFNKANPDLKIKAVE